MKYLFPAVLFLSLSAAFVACGGKEDEKPSTLEMCVSSCKRMAQCFEDSGSSDDAESCEEDCEEGIGFAKAEGCEDEVEALLSCQDKNLTCEIYNGSGEYPCPSQIRAYADCMDVSSGSGS